jgi:hypothetical protein
MMQGLDVAGGRSLWKFWRNGGYTGRKGAWQILALGFFAWLLGRGGNKVALVWCWSLQGGCRKGHECDVDGAGEYVGILEAALGSERLLVPWVVAIGMTW